MVQYGAVQSPYKLKPYARKHGEGTMEIGKRSLDII